MADRPPAVEPDDNPKTAPAEPAAERPLEDKPVEELPAPRVMPQAGATLDDVIRACLDADPKLRAGFEAVNQANADFLTSSLLPNPTFLGDGQLLPLTRPFTVDRQGGPPQTDYQVGFPIDWFVFGKRAAAMLSGQLGVEVAVADFADQVRQRVAAAIAAYFDVLEAQAMLELAQADLANLRRLEGITQERVKLGGVGSIELDRVRLALLDSQREVRNRERTHTVALANLRALMGAHAADPQFRVAGSLAVTNPAQPLPAEAVLALAEESRPDIESLRRQLTKAEADIHTEKTKGCPPLATTFGYTRQFQTKSIGFPDANSWMIQVTTELPFFNRNQGNIRKAESVLAQTQFNLQAQLVALRAEVVQAAEEFRTAQTNVTSDDPEQLKTAASVRDRIEAAYKAGGRPLIEVLDAERAYRETYRLIITGQSAYWHSLYRVNAAVGKQVLR